MRISPHSLHKVYALLTNQNGWNALSDIENFIKEIIHSNEELKLETSVFESFTVANLPHWPCSWYSL